MISETDNRKRADAEVVAWKFKYEKAEQEKLYAQTHQKTVEVAVEKKCLMRNAKNVTVLFTKKQKRNAITEKFSWRKNIKI